MKCKKLFIFAVACGMPSMAQAVVVPPNVEAGRVGEQPQALPEPALSGSEFKGYGHPVTAPKGAEKIHFTLHAITIDGIHAYPQDYFKSFYASMLGKDVTLADMYALADSIRSAYHEDGYVLTEVFLPVQSISNGQVRLHVTEGYVSRLRWTGNIPDAGLVADLGAEITDSRPFNSKVLENVMLRINELPGISAQAALEPLPEGAPEGAVGMTVTVEHKRIAGSLSIDDYASRYLGVWESVGKADGYGLLSPLDHISVSGTSGADAARLRFGAIQYSLPINTSGTILSAGVNDSFTHPSFRLASLDIDSYAQNVTAGITQPLIRSREESLDVGSQFGVSNQQTDVLKQRFTVDRIRTVTASATYNRTDRWDGANLLDVDVVHGLNILNATQPGSPFLSRADGRSDFTKLVFNASRLQGLPNDFSLLLAVTGQKSSVSLLTSQQFGYGGPAFGRAYDESEVTGDEGAAGRIELRWQTVRDGLWLQPFAFYHIGIPENRSAFSQSVSAASAGFGLRAQWKTWHMDTNLAWPLTLMPSVPKLGAEGKDPRINLSIGITF